MRVILRPAWGYCRRPLLVKLNVEHKNTVHYLQSSLDSCICEGGIGVKTVVQFLMKVGVPLPLLILQFQTSQSDGRDSWIGTRTN